MRGDVSLDRLGSRLSVSRSLGSPASRMIAEAVGAGTGNWETTLRCGTAGRGTQLLSLFFPIVGRKPKNHRTCEGHVLPALSELNFQG